MVRRAHSRVGLVFTASVTGLLVGAFGLPAVPAVAATAANPITYVYDDLGRLEAVIDAAQTNGLAKYVYDGVGNLTKITRTAIGTTPQIVDFQAHRVATGNPITVYGTGFSSTPSQDVVTFIGGATATATAATVTTATVTVPSSAQAGAIKIKNTATNKTSALSTQSWSAPAAAPVVTSITTAIGTVAGGAAVGAHLGDTVTLIGSGFSTNPADDQVQVNGTVVQVMSATATQLAFKVPTFDRDTLGPPPLVSSGAVTVRTASGVATAPLELALPEGVGGADPTTYDRFADIAAVGTQTFTLTSGQDTLVVLAPVTVGQTLYFSATSGNGEGLGINVFDPIGQAQGQCCFGAVYVRGVVARYTGTYVALITRQTTTGSVAITVQSSNSDLADGGTITPSPSATATIPRTNLGQWSVFRFPGTKNDNYCLDTTFNISQGHTYVYRPSHPDGEANGDAMLSSQGDLPPFQAPETGTYTVILHGDYSDPPTTENAKVTDIGSGTQCPPNIYGPVRAGGAGANLRLQDPSTVAASFSPTDPPTWDPGSHATEWRTGREPSPLEDVPGLMAASGVTAIAGQILALDGAPLPGVIVTSGASSATTDVAGRFLLQGVAAGRVVMRVDARPASTDQATYGIFQIGTDVAAGRTNELGYTIWEPALDMKTQVHIGSYPLKHDLVITSPKISGFEVDIPKGSTIVDSAGKPVHDVTLTPVPLDRPPFPGPEMNQFTMHFTLQPADATVEPDGFRVVYANNRNLPPGFTGRVWAYEPDEGWGNYGTATVTKDGKQVVPDRHARIEGFQGASMSPDMLALFDPLCSVPLLGRICSHDPVDYGNGLFDYQMTDLVEPGTPPITLTRYYRQNDATTYGTGLGMATSYDMLLNSSHPTDYAYIGIPGQQRVKFVPVNGPGTGVPMVAVSGPPEWIGAELVQSAHYTVRRRDGMRFQFGGNGAGGTWLTDIRDVSGNETIISRKFTNEILAIFAMPSGRWISLTRSGNGTLTAAADSAGRTVSYTYSNATPYRMLTVTDPTQQGLPNPAQTTYSWNPNTSFCSTSAPCSPSPATYLFDAYDRRNNHTIHLDYDSQGRIAQQTFANAGIQTFDYSSSDPLCSASTRTVDPDGNVACARFSNGQLTSVTTAQGTPLERTFTYGFDPNNKNVASVTDTFKVSGVTHTRQTTYTYDGLANVTQVTYLANTGSPKTWTYTYDPGYDGPTTITDPLGHQRRFTYSYPDGCMTRAEDNLSHGLTLTCSTTGAPKKITDDLGGQTVFTYVNGDLIKVKDPDGGFTKRFVGADGNLRAVSDPLGYATTLSYDGLGDLTKVAPVSGSSTSFSYDVEQNLTKVTQDATGAHTDYVYNELNLASSRNDPLSRQETFAYDPAGNLSKWVDRRGKVTRFCYDAQNDLSFIGYGYTGGGDPTCTSSFASSTTFKYDGAGRLGQVDDSQAGQITRTYDDLDRLTNETTPQGAITYTYDNANRRSTITVAGQPQTSYSYFTDDLLKTITRNTDVVAFAYDGANRPDTTTLANGIVENWTYDPAARMTQIDYDKGATHYGTLDYGYDAAGRRTTAWSGASGFARVTLPAATTSNATYDLANELTTWNGTSLTYDANGNIKTNGSQTYTFDERNELTATSGGTSTFKYDGLGRRYEKTVSGTTTRFLWDGANVAQELDGTNSVTANLITGFAPDHVLLRKGNANKNVLTDALGSTIATYSTATNPVLQTSFTYDPYGTPDSTAIPYLFTGREYDSATGLQYNRARYYTPGFGRFASEDPIRISGGSANGYLYGADAPTVFVDPFGLEPGIDRSSYFTFDYETPPQGAELGGTGFNPAHPEAANQGYPDFEDPTTQGSPPIAGTMIRFFTDAISCVKGAIEVAAVIPEAAVAPPVLGGLMVGGCALEVTSSETLRHMMQQ